MGLSKFPPKKTYCYLDVPGEVSLGCNAEIAQRRGVTGKGVKVAMVDSGFYAHPFFKSRGYRFNPVKLGPGASDPLKDESSHGTAEAANVFSIATDATLMPVKMSFVNSLAAFNTAVSLKPDIITCSWGSDRRDRLTAADIALVASISNA